MLRELAYGTREREPIPRGDAVYPVLTLNREMNRLFDSLYHGGYGVAGPAYEPVMGTWPTLDVEATDTDYRINVELPGIDEKDVEVLLDDDGRLTIRGEKRVAHEGAAFSERMYGQFERTVALGPDVDAAHCEDCKATFRNGVLSVFIPKAAEASQKARRIRVNENEAAYAEAPQGAPAAAQGAEAQTAASLRQAA